MSTIEVTVPCAEGEVAMASFSEQGATYWPSRETFWRVLQDAAERESADQAPDQSLKAQVKDASRGP